MGNNFPPKNLNLESSVISGGLSNLPPTSRTFATVSFSTFFKKKKQNTYRNTLFEINYFLLF
jgi:hypothetical protein